MDDKTQAVIDEVQEKEKEGAVLNAELVSPDTPVPEKPKGLVCPHCMQDPCAIISSNMTWPNGQVAVVFACQDCRAVLGLSFIGFQAPAVMGARGIPPGLIVPGR